MARILVTSALPYANGPVHFGHVAGAYLPADIFVRFSRLRGHEVLYICGSDEHGAPITTNAAKAGQDPATFTKHWHDEILRVFTGLGIRFDNFSRTSLPHHHQLSQRFFTEIRDNGFVREETTEQAYCVGCAMFLPDRYLIGTCPSCGYEKARGDECGKCGHWIEAGTLGSPRCRECDAPPETRETTHWYLELEKLQPKLEEWLAPRRDRWKPNVLAAVDKWLKEGLRARAITRDLDWGVKVPLEGADGKVLYVWFDAPIGYISSTIEWAERQGTPEAWRDWWCDPEVRLLHFIGKDNIVFHCLTWPAMLMAQDQDFVLPDDVPANEFYNLQGGKFSTSDGWYLDIDECFQRYDADALRYAIAASLPETADSEWTWEQFQVRVNSELNDAYGNLAQRLLKFVRSYQDGVVRRPASLDPRDQEELDALREAPARVAAHLEKFEVKKAIFEWLEVARRGNKYFNDTQPWKTRKTDPEACTRSLYVVTKVLATLAVLGQPFLPETSPKLWAQLGFAPEALAAVGWDDGGDVEVPDGHPVGEPSPLFSKVDDATIRAEVDALHARKAAMSTETETAAEAAPPLEPFADTIEFGDFVKVDLRVGVVTEAEEMPKSKKLLKLQVDLGLETRQILAGMKQWYKPEDLIGTRVVVVCNLAPRKMMGTESQGMILAATDPTTDTPVFLRPAGDVPPGSKIS